MGKKKNKNRLLLPGLLIGVCALTVFVKRDAIWGQLREAVGTKGSQAEDSGANGKTEEDTGNEQENGRREDSIKDSSADTAQTMPVWNQENTRSLEAGSILDVTGPDEAALQNLFYSEAISDEIFQRIDGISFQENDSISREELSYLRILHMGFDGQTHIGEMIVNEKIADDVLLIMQELYVNAYPIEKMELIDNYGGDDNASMADNNSSAFNYRVIAGTSKMSKHSLGLAVDINPRYNPYIRTGADNETIVEPENGREYADRSQDFPYKIDENDLSLKLFLDHGFTWGGHWNTMKDYQHFQKTFD